MASSLAMTADAPQAWDCCQVEDGLLQRDQSVLVRMRGDGTYRLQHLRDTCSAGFVRLDGPLIRGMSQDFRPTQCRKHQAGMTRSETVLLRRSSINVCRQEPVMPLCQVQLQIGWQQWANDFLHLQMQPPPKPSLCLRCAVTLHDVVQTVIR